MSQRQKLNGSDSRESPYGDRAAITLTRLPAPRAADERLRHRHRRQRGRASSLGSAFAGSIRFAVRPGNSRSPPLQVRLTPCQMSFPLKK
jgi:hypothetical protein